METRVHIMKATYDLTRDDLAAFIEFHQRTSPAAKQQRVGCLAVAFCAMMILARRDSTYDGQAGTDAAY